MEIYNYVVPEASSTCELVYNLLVNMKKINNTNIIDEEYSYIFIYRSYD